MSQRTAQRVRRGSPLDAAAATAAAATAAAAGASNGPYGFFSSYCWRRKSLGTLLFVIYCSDIRPKYEVRHYKTSFLKQITGRERKSVWF